MSQLFVGAGNSLQPIHAVGLDEEGLIEVSSRIKLQPNFMGEPLVVIAEAADFPQISCTKDDITLVALDVNGQVVVIELNQGISKSQKTLNCLRYASYIADLSIDELGKVARAFANRPSNLAISRSWQESNVEMNDESIELSSLLATTFSRDADDFAESINSNQRVIVAAEGFDSRMVEIVDWLSDCGCDIRGIQFQKFMIGGQEIFHAQQVVPDNNPSVDSSDKKKQSGMTEVEEPWKIKGLAYYCERLTPAMGAKLEELLTLLKSDTFALNWSQKYYFLLRGNRQNLRIRTYQKNRLDIGFLNATIESINIFLRKYQLDSYEAVSIGGYDRSPFVSINSDTELDDRWKRALQDWLSGKEL
ncbi:MAG: hypothetical protein ACYTFY_01370 [Planctomycetota bacterium]|jgi:hypothetical protein